MSKTHPTAGELMGAIRSHLHNDNDPGVNDGLILAIGAIAREFVMRDLPIPEVTTRRPEPKEEP